MIDQYVTPPRITLTLNSLKDLLLELSLNLLALVIRRRLSVQVQQSTQVELGGLEELHLANVDLKVKKKPSAWVNHTLWEGNIRSAGGRCPG